MHRAWNRLALLACALALPAAAALAAREPVSPAEANAPPAHNLVLFVPDGLRAGMVSAATAPALARLRDEGVNFRASHSLYPTFTTANASALATGHELGDTGDFSNIIDTGFAVGAAAGTRTPFLESDPVLREVNAHFGGDYLGEPAILPAARTRGFQTAIIGKLGPAAIFDLDSLEGTGALLIDDSTGHEGGAPVPAEWAVRIAAAGLPAAVPGRGANGDPGSLTRPGTWVANYAQQQYFIEMATRVVLPQFRAAHRPFVLVYWSRDPDGSQHNEGDSPEQLVPGINGPTSLAAIRAADSALGAIEQALEALDLAQSTDIIVAADHGFSTVTRSSTTSAAAQGRYADTRAHELPIGFLAIDLAEALERSDPGVKLFDPDAHNAAVDWRQGGHPSRGDALIGADPAQPEVIVAANGGSDLLYIPGDIPQARVRALGAEIVSALMAQDYVSGVFVDRERLGELGGALSLADIHLKGTALTPVPAIVVNFRSFGTGCGTPELCAAEVADTVLQQGQGMHGSFSRADTRNFMAARGPDFRTHYVDELPASNADVGRTIAQLLGLELVPRGHLLGRVLTESLRADPGHAPLKVSRRTLASAPAANGRRTLLQETRVGDSRYFDAGGFAGRTVGLPGEPLRTRN